MSNTVQLRRVDPDGTVWLASITPGLTWRLSPFKPYNRNQKPYASAWEGTLSNPLTPGGMVGFETIFGGPESSRTLKRLIPGGRMTARAIVEAMEYLEGQLRCEGYLERASA